ncbi:3,4-dihydroxy-2-butanone-4-phosphate synthase [Rhodococcus koreensis]
MLDPVRTPTTSSTVAARRSEVDLSAVAEGQPIVVASPQGCDLVILARQASSVATAFLIRHGTGFVSVAMTAERLEMLELPPQSTFDGRPQRPALHVAVDASAGITTGISAQDRACTIQLLGDPSSGPDAFTRPGHVIPVRANLEGNVPPGPAETAAMIGLLADDTPAAALCSLVSESDPTRIAQAEEGRQFAYDHEIPFVHSPDITRMFYHQHAMQYL